MDTDSYADVVERLFKEFDWALSLPEITRLVSECRQNLSASATLEGLENEARSRLTHLSLGAHPDLLVRLAQRTPVVGPQQMSEVDKTTLASA